MSHEAMEADANLSALADLHRALSSAYDAAFPGAVADSPRAAIGALVMKIGRLREEHGLLRAACESVMFFWEKDPEAFGDDASVTSLAGRFASVADQVRWALEATTEARDE